MKGGRGARERMLTNMKQVWSPSKLVSCSTRGSKYCACTAHSSLSSDGIDRGYM
jgi:hypothetical protein